jgi:hypothetical protein
MVVAVYCRKSTDQTGVADDQKSVARQIEYALAYASARGGRSRPNIAIPTTASAARSFQTGRGFSD